ncbi:MAG TPA: alpha/beta hydrolase-fold protein [Solirubrobacterales bacterium]|nr:alpha/beta hydrolase-fold protein [Solirubrobacterales bacterium]
MTLALVAATYLVLAATVFAPVDRHGARLVHIEVHSKAVGRDLGVNVLVPPRAGPRGERSLLVFLHGRGGSEVTFNDAVFRGLPSLHGRRGPVVAFPAGGVHGYWHDRADGDWGKWVMDEVIPLVIRRFGIDPHRLAIGGISMGGFGAYDIALKNPGRFCAVGGHSPALWFDGSETAPGAFDDRADFERNDVVEAVQTDPDAFGDTRVWNDYGDEDPFRVYDEGFIAALRAGDADLSAHSWPGAHEGGYWDAHWPAYQRFYVNALNHCG